MSSSSGSTFSTETLRDLAVQCALQGGHLALEMRTAGVIDESENDSKSSITDLVTQADREVEILIKSMICDQRPEDSILGEEGGTIEGTSGLRWVIDPVDGTVNYYYQYPGWVVSVAVESEQNEIIAGAIYDPINDAIYDATCDEKARYNKDVIKSPARENPKTIEQALVATGFGYQAERRKSQAQALVTILPEIRDIRRGGAAAMDLCHLATGRVDAYFERGLKPWDYAAGLLIARQSGCRVEILEEKNGEAFLLAARSEKIYTQLLDLLQRSGAI